MNKKVQLFWKQDHQNVKDEEIVRFNNGNDYNVNLQVKKILSYWPLLLSLLLLLHHVQVPATLHQGLQPTGRICGQTSLFTINSSGRHHEVLQKSGRAPSGCQSSPGLAQGKMRLSGNHNYLIIIHTEQIMTQLWLLLISYHL